MIPGKPLSWWEKIAAKDGSIIGDFTSIESYTKPLHDDKGRDATELLILQAPDHSRILDVGCNTGIMCYRLRKRGWKGEYTGVDLNEAALQHARRLIPDATFIRDDIEALTSIADKSFPTVVSSGVIEHLPDYKAALSELLRVCSKTLVLDSFIKLGDSRKDEYHSDGVDLGYYLNQYSAQDFINLAGEKGFDFSGKPEYDDGTDFVYLFTKAL